MLFCLACNSVPENWHTCVKKGYLFTTDLTRALRRVFIAVTNHQSDLPVDLGISAANYSFTSYDKDVHRP